MTAFLILIAAIGALSLAAVLYLARMRAQRPVDGYELKETRKR